MVSILRRAVAGEARLLGCRGIFSTPVTPRLDDLCLVTRSGFLGRRPRSVRSRPEETGRTSEPPFASRPLGEKDRESNSDS